MAIKKEIKDNRGVTVSYHRVAKITSIVNYASMIEVSSYISKEDRELEQGNPSFSNVYNSTIYYDIPYTDNLSVKGAYDYIKSLPEFEGAEDVDE